MKANELRIGNLVLLTKDSFKTSNVYQLDGFDIYKSEESECFDINPIPLTEEWLLKFSFKKWDIKGDWVFEKVIFKDFSIEQKMIICSSGTCSLEEKENHPEVEVEKFIIREDIIYVHQLQNLYFALTGQELEYEQL